MVKGISRQVIVVQSPDPKLFEQAIFILKDEAIQAGVTQELLMKEAQQAVRDSRAGNPIPFYRYGAVWACGGSLLTGILWLLTTLL